jgi:hypothetical protein
MNKKINIQQFSFTTATKYISKSFINLLALWVVKVLGRATATGFDEERAIASNSLRLTTGSTDPTKCDRMSAAIGKCIINLAKTSANNSLVPRQCAQ